VRIGRLSFAPSQPSNSRVASASSVRCVDHFREGSLWSVSMCSGRLSGRALLRRSGGPIRHARAL